MNNGGDGIGHSIIEKMHTRKDKESTASRTLCISTITIKRK